MLHESLLSARGLKRLPPLEANMITTDRAACCDQCATDVRCNLCGALHCHVHNKVYTQQSDGTHLCRAHVERYEQCLRCKHRIPYRKGMQCAARGCFANVCTTFSAACNSRLESVLVCAAHAPPCRACGEPFAQAGARRVGPGAPIVAAGAATMGATGDIYCARCFEACVAYIVWRRQTMTHASAINKDVLRIIVKYLSH